MGTSTGLFTVQSPDDHCTAVVVGALMLQLAATAAKGLEADNAAAIARGNLFSFGR
jgi:hypothetical protein